MHGTMDHAEAEIRGARQGRGARDALCIAIVDSEANLKAFSRINDARVGSIDIATKKAKTAVFFAMPNGAIGRLSQPGGSLYGIEHSIDGLITLTGGLPIVDEHGVLVGAIGAGGSSVENDEAVAKAGVAVLGAPNCRASLENVTDHLPGFREGAASIPSA